LQLQQQKLLNDVTDDDGNVTRGLKYNHKEALIHKQQEI
jgi:hypothetical protein